MAAARESSGFQQVQEIEGVLGVLGELVDVEPGWETAVEAALGSVLASVVVEDVKTARIALERLGASEASGASCSRNSPPFAARDVVHTQPKDPRVDFPSVGEPMAVRIQTSARSESGCS